VNSAQECRDREAVCEGIVVMPHISHKEAVQASPLSLTWWNSTATSQ
jgi:hypothetical protein